MQKLSSTFIEELLERLGKDDSFLNKTYCSFGLNAGEGNAKDFVIGDRISDGLSDMPKIRFECKVSGTGCNKINSNTSEIKKKIIAFYAEKGVLFCPYCGLNQYQKVQKGNGNKVDSFELDHFLDKGKYPEYACSLYNLIPVCMYCNQRIKHTNSFTTKEFNNKRFFHVFYGWIQWNFYEQKFTQASDKNFDELTQTQIKKDDFSKFCSNNKIENGHTLFFRLNQIYTQSPIVKNELTYIRKKTQNIKNSGDDIRSIGLNPIELFFEHYPKSQDEILRHSAGKLKKDIISKIKIIFKK